ncbi:lysophospholipase catalytic domain-containing protein [Trametes polyzona]|nr:lysophospholipase catalytic domain-containing protein [Trametes polyzona]
MRARIVCLLAAVVPLVAGQQSVAEHLYAPTLRPCPANTLLVREVGHNAVTQSLGENETVYIAARKSLILPNAWATYALNVQRSAPVSLPIYVNTILNGSFGPAAFPNLGIATSGGGFRAALFGAGVLNALDGRNQTSVQAGLGGLLQAAQYISGLSGGSWLVSSLAQANFPMLQDLVFGTQLAVTGDDSYGGWITPIDLLEPNNNPIIAFALIDAIVFETQAKFNASFPVSVTDAWGRSLARHFVNGTSATEFIDTNSPHGAGITLSGVANVPTFRGYAQPFPIIIADSLAGESNEDVGIKEDGDVIPLANPIYEFNVFETGSFDPVLGAFTPTKYLGSPNNSVCASGFDQLSFVIGASSNTFNAQNTSADALGNTVVGPIIIFLQETAPQEGVRLDSALVPNPFYGLSPDTFVDTNSTILSLVDGGEDGETTPFQPLLVKARGLDTIIAIDAPADTSDNFANGHSLIATQARAELFNASYAFPPVPRTPAEFLAHPPSSSRRT